jgi:pilus assembly protein CpaB
MNIARVVVLIIALSAGGVAAYLARGTEEKPRAAAEPVAQLPTVEILVAKSDIGLGQPVKPDDLQWQAWPASAAISDQPHQPRGRHQGNRRFDCAHARLRGRADP